jgi:hypothetical protein
MAELTANVAPAASFRSTAADMARFMIAHLASGRFGEEEILKSETARLMHTRSFSHAPQVNGMAHGFWELDLNGRRIIGHAGSHPVFNSLLLLFPDEGLGIFIATNSRGGSAFIGDNFTVFPRDFVDRFYPVKRQQLVAPIDFQDRAALYRGSYHTTFSRSESSPEKLFSLLMSLKIRSARDGLRLSLPSGSVDLVEETPLVFRAKDGEAPLVFRADAGAAGAITEAFYGPIPLTALIKNRWFETLGFNLARVGSCLILFLSHLIGALAALRRRERAERVAVHSRLERIARLSALTVSLAGPLTLFLALASLFNFYGLLVGDLPLWPLVRLLSVATALSAAATLATAVPAWKRHLWKVGRRIHYTLVALASVSFVWFLWFWNLLGVGF